MFAEAFARSLLSIAPELADELAVLRWPGSEQDVYRTLFPELDAAIHWGGEKSQQAISVLAAEYEVPLLTHGPKFSFSYLDEPSAAALPQLVEGVVRDTVLWEQKACSSPRFLLVRSGGDDADSRCRFAMPMSAEAYESPQVASNTLFSSV